ncbi:MAG TPA: hypothetical protein VLX59_18415, partial [Acidimicrobiales bacterium]|nr:hypothetical protein [Acidimicrobiales bacterium]
CQQVLERHLESLPRRGPPLQLRVCSWARPDRRPDLPAAGLRGGGGFGRRGRAGVESPGLL